MRRAVTFGVLAVSAALLAGCETTESGGAPAKPRDDAHAAVPAPAPNPWAAVTEAVAVVQPTKGNSCHGTVRITDAEGGVRIVADIEGLSPSAHHAFHFHEAGDLSSGDGKSAGAHYNPGGHHHGGPDAPDHHAGDLGNIETDASGRGHYDRVVAGISVAGAAHPLLGRSVVIHAKVDDLTSQPAGNAGDRIGWGVVGVAAPPAKPAK